MSDINEEIARSYYNRSSDQIMSNEQKQFFDNLDLIRILEEKNQELQNRIYKAIEYMENTISEENLIIEYEFQNVIDILKGDNK